MLMGLCDNQWICIYYINWSLKTKFCHDAIFITTGEIRGCYDNCQCCQWQKVGIIFIAASAAIDKKVGIMATP